VELKDSKVRVRNDIYLINTLLHKLTDLLIETLIE
jgi:hypothetical protein